MNRELTGAENQRKGLCTCLLPCKRPPTGHQNIVRDTTGADGPKKETDPCTDTLVQKKSLRGILRHEEIPEQTHPSSGAGRQDNQQILDGQPDEGGQPCPETRPVEKPPAHAPISNCAGGQKAPGETSARKPIAEQTHICHETLSMRNCKSRIRSTSNHTSPETLRDLPLDHPKVDQRNPQRFGETKYKETDQKEAALFRRTAELTSHEKLFTLEREKTGRSNRGK